MKKIVMFMFTSMVLLSCGIFKGASSYSRKDIAAEVKEIVVEVLGVDESEINRETSYLDDLGVDELDVAELIMAFEKEFDIFIPDEDIPDLLTTYGDTIRYITKKVNSGNVY